MAKVSVYNIEGKEVDTIELNDAVFGVEVNELLLNPVLRVLFLSVSTVFSLSRPCRK